MPKQYSPFLSGRMTKRMFRDPVTSSVRQGNDVGKMYVGDAAIQSMFYFVR